MDNTNEDIPVWAIATAAKILRKSGLSAVKETTKLHALANILAGEAEWHKHGKGLEE